MGMRSVDELVSDLSDLLRELGLPTPELAQASVILDEIDEAIAPARLPASARRLWELIDPARLHVGMYPQLSDAGFGLDSWKEEHDGDGFNPMQPRHFFQLCYSSHDTLWIECDGPDWTGGALFESFISDPGFPFTLLYASVEDWLEVMIAGLRDGAYELVNGTFADLDDDRVRQLAAERLAAGKPDPVVGTNTEIPTDYEQWPAEWRRRSGIVLDEPALDGVSSIAEVMRASRLQPVRATVRGTVVRHFGSQLVIFDATGQLQVAIPKSFSGSIPVGYEHVLDLEMPARGEPTPALRDPSFHMSPLRRHNFDLYKANADALVKKVQRTDSVSTNPEQNVAEHALVFRRHPYIDQYRPNPKIVPEVGQITDLLQAIPGVLVRCIPPRPALNDLLRRGKVEPGERPGCEWDPFELSAPEYDDLVQELKLEGTRVAPFTWGDYAELPPPGETLTWEEYLERRDSLLGTRRTTLDDIATDLREAQHAVDTASDDELVAAARLDLWEAQRPLVLYLRHHWRGKIHYRGWIELERLGSAMLVPTVALFEAQRALWFATKANDKERIARARAAFAAAQQRLAEFLNVYGPGGTHPPGFEDTIEPSTRWKPPFPVFGLTPNATRLPPTSTRREQWAPEKRPTPTSEGSTQPAAQLIALTIYYGQGATGDYLAVMTSPSRDYEPLRDGTDPTVDALALAVRSYNPWRQAPPITGDDSAFVADIRSEITSATQRWLVDGEPHQATTYSARQAHATRIELPSATVIISGTVPLDTRELVTITDLGAHGI